MQTGKVFAVCGNTFDMLHESRLAPHFDFIGDKSRHFGLFPGCEPGEIAAAGDTAAQSATSGCC